MRIQTNTSDIIWSYVGTLVSMASGFVLLPALMWFLTDDELGLWYIYISVANLVALFEFGFQPTFARNITYIISGARSLLASGCSNMVVKDDIDWELLNRVISASKIIYAGISLVALLTLTTIGTAYIAYITSNLESKTVWISWILFCAAIVFNLYFLYSLTILRGYGDIAGENQVKVFAKVSQLAISFILLYCGMGLIGAAIGYLANTVILRILALLRIRKHKDLQLGRAQHREDLIWAEILSVLRVISHVAWRDGAVQIALFMTTQFTSIICSLYLGLAEAGTYSILLQLCTAAYNFACAYSKSFYPSIQANIATSRFEQVREMVSKGIVSYWILYSIGSIGIAIIVLPILPLFNSEFAADYGLFFCLCVYLGLLQQHSLFCNYIVSLNEIPYLVSYILSSIAGCFLSAILCSHLAMGAYGLVIGQGIAQLAFNNWYWPKYFCKRVGATYFSIVQLGIKQWKMKCHKYTK